MGEDSNSSMYINLRQDRSLDPGQDFRSKVDLISQFNYYKIISGYKQQQSEASLVGGGGMSPSKVGAARQKSGINAGLLNNSNMGNNGGFPGPTTQNNPSFRQNPNNMRAFQGKATQ